MAIRQQSHHASISQSECMRSSVAASPYRLYMKIIAIGSPLQACAASWAATSKLLKAWESKNSKNAAKAGGFIFMAVSLAACGGSSTTTAVAPVVADSIVETPVAQSLTLTTAVDDITGGEGADTISGIQTGGTDETFSAYDAIDGGAGVGTLKITNTEAGVLNLANVSNVENIEYRSVGGGRTVDMVNFTGEFQLTLDRSAGALDVANLDLTTTLVINDATATKILPLHTRRLVLLERLTRLWS